MATKQVIVMRNDLNMRKGKMIAQGSHASMSFLTKDMIIGSYSELEVGTGMYKHFSRGQVDMTDDAKEWLRDSFTKITVQVSSEEELIQIHEKAIQAGLTTHLIKDAGRTEFGGVPTYTCCAIGPNQAEKIDEITGDLRLL